MVPVPAGVETAFTAKVFLISTWVLGKQKEMTLSEMVEVSEGVEASLYVYWAVEPPETVTMDKAASGHFALNATNCVANDLV